MLVSYAEWLLKNLDWKKGERCKWTDGCQTAVEFLKAHPEALVKQIKKFQTDDLLHNFEVIADYIQENLEIYFQDKIERAKQKFSYNNGDRKRMGSNDLLFDKLPDTFTLEDARMIKGPNVSDNSVRQMLKNWKKQGLVIQPDECTYQKVKQHP